MIEQFTNAELEQILKEIEERKQLAKSRTKSTVCGNELAKIKSRLASMTESKVSGWNAIRSAILCYCDLVTGNFRLEKQYINGQPFVSIARPKDIQSDVDLDQYKQTIQEVSQTIIDNLQMRLNEN